MLLVKGFRTAAAVNADAANLERTSIAFRDAELMLEQLVKYTGKRIITRVGQKSWRYVGICSRSNRAFDWSACAPEMDRNHDCKLYEVGTSRWDYRPRQSVKRLGQRREADPRGLDSAPSQPIFRLLDSSHIQVKAEVNESQVALIRPGQPVVIHLEAFPDRSLLGSVAEIVPIPSRASGTSPMFALFSPRSASSPAASMRSQRA